MLAPVAAVSVHAAHLTAGLPAQREHAHMHTLATTHILLRQKLETGCPEERGIAVGRRRLRRREGRAGT